jgi:integrase
MALTKKFLEGRDPKSGRRRDETPGRWADEGGLFLKVTKSGGRYWTVRLKFGRRDTELSVGPYPKTTIQDARKERDKVKGDYSRGKHPRGSWRNAAASASSSEAPTFGDEAERFVAAREGQWSRRYTAQWRRIVEVYCESIVDVPIPDVTTAMVLEILEPIWSEKPETARRLRERIEAILGAGYVRLELDKASPARWKNWLSQSLVKIDRPSRVRHHPAMSFENIPAFMARLKALEIISARCLEFVVLTAVRTSEARLAEWSEIDWGGRIWNIPASRMKKRKPHRVPLSEAAIGLLERCQAVSGASRYIFRTPHSERPLGLDAMAQLVQRMGITDATVHGMRAAFRSWCKNRGVPYELAEECLAHVPGDKTVRAYDRDDALELRAEWMKRWGQHCTNVPAPEAFAGRPDAK